MINGCKVYVVDDPHKKTLFKIDFESVTAQNDSGNFGAGDMVSVGGYLQAQTKPTAEIITPRKHGVIIPEYGDFVVTSLMKTKINHGGWRSKFRYLLTLEN